MNDLKQRIHDDSNGLDYVLVGDYYIPDLILDKPKAEPEEQRSIGKWGRMHREYLKECRPVAYNESRAMKNRCAIGAACVHTRCTSTDI